MKKNNPDDNLKACDDQLATHNPLLLEEYKLIQAKIDKFGEDKFKVRSWCFTLVAGVVAATKLFGASDNSWLGPWLLLLFLPAVGAFHLVELRQNQISKRLGSRAAEIELAWRKERVEGQKHLQSPNLASHLIKESTNDEMRYSHFSISNFFKTLYDSKELHKPDVPLKSGPRLLNRLSAVKAAPSPTFVGYLIMNAENLFYYVQYILVIIIVALLSCEMYLHQKPEKEESALIMRLGTNDFQLFVSETNCSLVACSTTNFNSASTSPSNNATRNNLTTNNPHSGPSK